MTPLILQKLAEEVEFLCSALQSFWYQPVQMMLLAAGFPGSDSRLQFASHISSIHTTEQIYSVLVVYFSCPETSLQTQLHIKMS